MINENIWQGTFNQRTKVCAMTETNVNIKQHVKCFWTITSWLNIKKSDTIVTNVAPNLSTYFPWEPIWISGPYSWKIWTKSPYWLKSETWEPLWALGPYFLRYINQMSILAQELWGRIWLTPRHCTMSFLSSGVKNIDPCSLFFS